MNFPNRDFTNQFISSSYQDVLQQYLPSEIFYVLDGIGNVVFILPSSSVGDMLISSNMTSSMIVASASYAVTYSYINSIQVSSSFSSASVSSSYALTSSYSENSEFSLSSYYSMLSESGSYALTASYVDIDIYSYLANSASWASNSLSSSYTEFSNNSMTSDFASLAGDSITAKSASYAKTSSYTIIASYTDNKVQSVKYSSTSTISEQDTIIYADASSGSIILIMPDVVKVTDKIFKIKKIDPGGHPVIISSSVNIDYDTELIISNKGTSVTLHSDSTQFWIH